MCMRKEKSGFYFLLSSPYMGRRVNGLYNSEISTTLTFFVAASSPRRP